MLLGRVQCVPHRSMSLTRLDVTMTPSATRESVSRHFLLSSRVDHYNNL